MAKMKIASNETNTKSKTEKNYEENNQQNNFFPIKRARCFFEAAHSQNRKF